MKNIPELSDNLILFPGTNSNIPECIIEENEYEKGSLEYHKNRGLELFLPNEDLANTQILVDNQNEITRISNNILIFDGHNNVWDLLSQPSKSQELIAAREGILDTINELPIVLKNKLLSSRKEVLKMGGFIDTFDHFYDLPKIIKSIEEGKESLWGIFGEGVSGNELEKVRKLIPGYLQLVRNIPGDFFIQTANTLSELFKEAGKFSLEDLKRIYKEEDYKSFSDLKDKVERFVSTYCHFDGVVIASIWADRGYIHTLKEAKEDEYAKNIKDPRPLLTGDIDDFHSHVSNHIPKGKQVDVYTGGNGSGKSTWLKTRLMLQLFAQTYGKVASKDAHIKLRNQITFINRGGSGYGEDLSAFGNDIQRKLMSFLPNLEENALIFLDEFGSTIPEKEAYCLIRALVEYLEKRDARIYMATHNELYIHHTDTDQNPKISNYHFQSQVQDDGTIEFSHILEEGKDNAHTLKVFKTAGMPDSVLQRASGNMLGNLTEIDTQQIKYKDIVSYTAEEKEELKKINKGLEGLTRRNEMVKFFHDKDDTSFYVQRKYKPLSYKEIPRGYSDEDLFFLAYHPENSGKEAPQLSFDFMQYGEERIGDIYSNPVFFPDCLDAKGSRRGELFSNANGTAFSLVTWGLTNDIKDIGERQDFFEKIAEWSYDDAQKIYANIRDFTWILSGFQSNGMFGKSLDFDYSDLSRFNTVYWEGFFKKIENDKIWYNVPQLYEWFLILIDMEEKLENLPLGFKEKHKEFLSMLQKDFHLFERLHRAKKRAYEQYKKDFEKSAIAAQQICDNIEKIITEDSRDEEEVFQKMKVLYDEISTTSKDVDILTMDTQQRVKVVSFLDENKIFQSKDSYAGESLANGFTGMTQVVRSLRGTGNLVTPFLDKLRSLDTVYTHQLANYLEEFTDIPDVEYFIEELKKKRDNPKGYRNKSVNLNRNHLGAPFMEILGLIDIANTIKKLNWTKVEFNNTGEIEIQGMTHPGLKKKQSEQVSNDFHLDADQSFDILEGATMGGKTVHVQSMQWMIRLAHSVGYVPAKSATIPCFDGLVYIDRVLEDEKNKLSAGQNDAKVWSEIILKIRNTIREKSEKGKYWFAIDEMISSVPARFQKGLVSAVLEELTSLGQRGQISIHNPELVSKLLEKDEYTVHHPEVLFDEQGKLKYTYNILPGRSLDEQGNFTAYSLETAESMGLPQEIIETAKKYKNEI